MYVFLVLEKAEATSDHDRDFPEMDIGEETLMGGFATVLVVSACDIDTNIHGERGCVCEVAEPGVIGKHRKNCTVVLKDGWFSQLGFLKFNLDLVFIAHGSTGEGG
jgi:hypothetical protein